MTAQDMAAADKSAVAEETVAERRAGSIMANGDRLIRKGGHRTVPNLKDTAADHIREQILRGLLRPGGKVDQDEIATTLGISRLPVREALIELAQEGFVEAIPRRGAFVVELDVDDILDHYQVYGLVAGLAARRCAERITPADLARLKAVHEEMTSTSDPARQAELNFQFHRIINHAGGSRQLLSILWFLGRALPVGLFRFSPEWESTAAAHHGLILSALEAGDPDSAAASVDRHLREAGMHLVDALRARGYWAEPPPAG